MEPKLQTPPAWVRFVGQHARDVAAYAVYARVGTSAYKPITEVIYIPDVDGDDLVDADAIAHEAYAYAYAQAEELGRLDSQIVLLDEEGNQLGRCAKGGRIDLRGQRPSTSASGEEGDGAVIGYMGRLIEQLMTANSKITSQVVTLVGASANAMSQVHSASEQAIGLLSSATHGHVELEHLRQVAAHTERVDHQRSAAMEAQHQRQLLTRQQGMETVSKLGLAFISSEGGQALFAELAELIKERRQSRGAEDTPAAESESAASP